MIPDENPMNLDPNPDPMNLDKLPGVWRGRTPRRLSGETVATGFDALDAALPGGGWPLGCVTEILSRRTGMGELSVLLPALARLSQEGRWVSWISPAHIPYAPALSAAGLRLSRMLLIHPPHIADRLWSAEQALRYGHGSVALIWLVHCHERAIRRLQIAAAESGSWGILLRPQRYAIVHSPAALRLIVEKHRDGFLDIDLLKCRGGRPVRLRA